MLGNSLHYYAEWHSLFMIAKGVVIPQPYPGLHHAVQIARECAVALVHLPQVDPGCIPEGNWISIDGRKGTVSVLEHRKMEPDPRIADD